jgi:hypothetical protein
LRSWDIGRIFILTVLGQTIFLNHPQSPMRRWETQMVPELSKRYGTMGTPKSHGWSSFYIILSLFNLTIFKGFPTSYKSHIFGWRFCLLRVESSSLACPTGPMCPQPLEACCKFVGLQSHPSTVTIDIYTYNMLQSPSTRRYSCKPTELP